MNLPADSPIKLRISSSPTHLPVVRAAVSKVCEISGLDEEACGNIMLCVDEALTNIIRHAYDGAPDRPIEIELCTLGPADSPCLRIRLRDYGKHVDPSKIKSRDLSDVRPGGLGVHIITECMDSVEFAPGEGGGTVLTMTKTLHCVEETRQ